MIELSDIELSEFRCAVTDARTTFDRAIALRNEAAEVEARGHRHEKRAVDILFKRATKETGYEIQCDDGVYGIHFTVWQTPVGLYGPVVNRKKEE